MGYEDQHGLYIGKVFQVSLRNANIRAKSVKGGWKYEFVAEMTADDFDLFNGHDLTGSAFEAQIECVEVAQQKLLPDNQPEGPEKQKGGSLAQSAALLCKNEDFQDFVAVMHGIPAGTRLVDIVASDGIQIDVPQFVATYVRRCCGVSSRAELDHSEIAAKHFQELMSEYREWLENNRRKDV